MSLGKRARPMRRTTSISGMAMALDLDFGDPVPARPSSYTSGTGVPAYVWDEEGAGAPVASPRVHRRHPSEIAASGHFLHTCCLCKRSLVPCRDIYMYRGDMAFCSKECRQLQMNIDERKDKCSLSSKKEASER
ncbi:hypothetical protein MLD38_001662 [Melastoma candidum]|uniref:Uncharacterized protein n=1 Tax=Melastoma candidum TaxID=119954 RepID=A0ACB9SHX1_9MYRT|nr:hypothetical protein MLD38_001662 [Melastoma candidum]